MGAFESDVPCISTAVRPAGNDPSDLIVQRNPVRSGDPVECTFMPAAGGMIRIQLIDNQGIVRQSGATSVQALRPELLRVPTTGCTPGVHYLRISTGAGETFTRKIVVAP